MSDLALAWRIARRDLRGGLRGFRLFLACLAIGVAAIAGVGSLSQSILAGIRADARVLLGGDVDLRLTHRTTTAEQRNWLKDAAARVSEIAEMRAMAVAAGGRARSLIELKAVDASYPLYGGFRLAGDADRAAVLAQRGDAWGAAADRRLLEKLGVDLGARLRIGDIAVVLTAVIEREADRGTRAFNMGPRVMISKPALAATGLVQPGSLIRYHTRIALPAGVTPKAWIGRLEARFPEAGWRIRSIERAAPNIQRFVDRVTLFLSLVGLTALLVGGVGIGNAVRSFLDSRMTSIATLKCLGAGGPMVFRIYLLQILALAVVGVAMGVAAGGAISLAVVPFLSENLPVAARAGLYPAPLIKAGLFGLLTAAAFSLWPLGQARDVAPGGLFRAAVAPPRQAPRGVYVLWIVLTAAVLAVLVVVTAHRPLYAAWFVVGAAVTLLLFVAAARIVAALFRRAPRPRRPLLRLAIANIARPGAPTASVVLALGMGLTVLVAVAVIEANLERQINRTIPEEAPGFYFIDIQTDQLAAFKKVVAGFPGIRQSESVPMMRGRIVRLNDTPVAQIKAPPEVAWILRGDRGLTWARKPPTQGSKVVAGTWWPEDYNGPPLVSFDARAAAAFGLKIGDTITVNLLGREVSARIATLREIDWTTLSMNFVLIFSPGLLEGAPQTHIATAKAAPAVETALEKAVTDKFPNISAIRVKEILEGVNEILGRLGMAVRAIAAVAVLAGALVLSGAIAASHRRRVYDSVVLKVLGARRRSLLASYLIEFGLLGAVTAILAAVIGSFAGWAVVVQVMHAKWQFTPEPVAITMLICLAITQAMGFLGTWRALGQKPAPHLRND
ncbi:MAG: FtsX-like permease family protein [Alphaproteobacteria bacterium]|nr:FtsX-like permease family protein [Alphaproteobacteria bacterium]